MDLHSARRAIFHILLEQAVKFFPSPALDRSLASSLSQIAYSQLFVKGNNGNLSLGLDVTSSSELTLWVSADRVQSKLLMGDIIAGGRQIHTGLSS